MKKNILVIGAGAVGIASVQKCAQYSHVFSQVCFASRTLSKCEAVVDDIKQRNEHFEPGFTIFAKTVDAFNQSSIVALIKETQSDIVINVCTAFANMTILEACIEAGAAYLDTAVHEEADVLNSEYPWYEEFEWTKKPICEKNGITAILGVGFDPGVVNAYCSYAQDHEFDSIDSIDILDVNAGNHGHFFATNFDPEINLREIIDDAGCLEDGQWRSYPHHSRSMEFDMPVVGTQKLYLMGHDEVHSLPNLIDGVKDVRFWMGFNDHYINCLTVFKEVGLLGIEEITTADGQKVVPLHVLKACLPDPASLAEGYTGKTCIGTLIKGQKDGSEKEVFIYNICDHQETYADIGTQAVAFTAGVPPVAAAILIAQDIWKTNKMVNVEELDSVPFINLLNTMGLATQMQVIENGEPVDKALQTVSKQIMNTESELVELS